MSHLAVLTYPILLGRSSTKQPWWSRRVLWRYASARWAPGAPTEFTVVKQTGS